jgi:DNA-binding beta-propeller fold protein YncE
MPSSTFPGARAGRRELIRAGIACLLATLVGGASAQDASGKHQGFYRLESSLTMKSERPDWDYLSFDPERSRLFMARRGDGVSVYDAKAGKRLDDIADSAEANATTLAEPFDRGYTINADGSATVFELSTLKTLDRVSFGASADSAVFEPATGQLLVMMGDEHAIAFLDARNGKKLGELKVEAGKLDGAAADGHGNVFVAQRDRTSVARIDARNRTMSAEWKTEGCEEPTGLAYDSASSRIFVGCRGKQPVLAVIDAGSGKVVATPEIGRGNDGVIFDAGKVYTSNGVDANLVVYAQKDPDHYELVEATTTRPYARTMAMDRATKKLYLVTAEGTVDPAQKVNRGPAPFYPNDYYPDTFTLLIFAPQ